MNIGDVNFNGLFPLIIFVISICSLTLFRSLIRTNYNLHRRVGVISTISASSIVVISQLARWRKFDQGLLGKKDLLTLNGLVSTDRISVISILVISLISILVSLSASSYLKSRKDIPAGEFFILLQIVILGMFAFVMANDLVAIFIALETFSIPLYVLTAYDARRLRSLEAGFKYFIMGAVSSAIFLYGVALHYGLTGSTALVGVAENSSLANVSMVLLSVGLLFKVAAFPFHFWSPDAYQGAPSPITTFMSASTKLAAFVVFARLVSTNVIDAGINGPSGRVLLTLACLTSAIFGATVALKQSNIKRAIAYSSISHTGYILLAMKSGGSLALGPVITYVIAYGFIIVGTYLVIGYLSTPNEQNDSILSINALAKTNPYIAGSLTVFLLAQAGIPLTSGFIAKFEVFRVALDSKFYITSLIVLIATVISAAFYLKLILSMYSDSFNHDTEKVIDVKANIVPKPTSIAIGVCVFITVAIGVFPSLLTGFTNVL
ncbi:MAG: NADH-quinone oxidoreductase subunit N [Acidimicrobiia bacterium]|nr:NADH-quinone oxidoreductase subunit N [Acidimicrobiia bacterium]